MKKSFEYNVSLEPHNMQIYNFLFQNCVKIFLSFYIKYFVSFIVRYGLWIYIYHRLCIYYIKYVHSIHKIIYHSSTQFFFSF